MTLKAHTPPQAVVEQASADTLLIRLSGVWRMDGPTPSTREITGPLTSGGMMRKITFDTGCLSDWDSSLLVFIIDLKQGLAGMNLDVDVSGLPEGARNILAIASVVPEQQTGVSASPDTPFLVSIGQDTLAFFSTVSELLAFVGEAALSFFRLISGKAGFRMTDFTRLLRQCGADAMTIVSMISFMVGLILAFIGAIQLAMFGAQIYVADLVGIGMTRVMAAVMTGVIMTGRTGAAFAAQLGTMQVNEELDALEALGISPMDFLVMPRMLALTLMMPMLYLHAVLMSILGGMVVGVGLLDLGFVEYLIQTKNAVGLTQVWIGLFHSLAFGVLVSLSGCLRGLQCGRSASAVGRATTSAVVTGIVSIVLATAMITLICNVLGI